MTCYLSHTGLILLLMAIYYFHAGLFKDDEFSCRANFVQHYPDLTLNISLDYHFSGKKGMVSMNGYIVNEPEKIFNRKIYFSYEKNGDIYYLHPEKNVIFPGNNVESKWLEKYEPKFFINSEEDLYLRILEQGDDKRMFIFSTIPTYICHAY
ncbi:hypothetical protein [Intestinirhabdus alba]|uniref:FidL n=1 Tax=Intestinirhabdus alba TaxID=2899544 RepID=A0A6L6IJ41_9ENTR|nr:hypothetical protein [Intestinirhabdus alba]MTH45718.1 hypothetical protein [Intestinirhabdus alba]